MYVALAKGVQVSLSDFRAALPEGTPVVMFLQELDPNRLSGGSDRVIAWERGRPEGSVLYEPYPQGLVFEDERQIVGGIDDLPEDTGWVTITTLDGLVERLR